MKQHAKAKKVREKAGAGLHRWLWCLMLGLGLAAYANSFAGVFVFDDVSSIIENPLITEGGWEWIWKTPEHVTVSGRPAVQWTFALNYFLHGEAVWGYHLVNVLIHLGNAGLLCLLLRKLLRDLKADPFWSALPFAVAGLWVVHPLTTAAVTNVVQRAESQAVFFYLVAFWGAIRWMDGKRMVFLVLAGGASWLGALSKELLVTLPVVVLAYDRMVLKKSWQRIASRHGLLYGVLLSTWILIAFLFFTGSQEDVTAVTETSRWDYLRTQVEVIPHYLQLALWPDVLVFDYYRWPLPKMDGLWWVKLACLVAGAVAATAGLIWRKVWALPLILFYLWLAPYSSLVPIVDPAFEHRMYLPLVAVVGAILGGGGLVVHRISKRSSPRVIGAGAVILLTVVAITLAVRTHIRNQDYHSRVRLWTATVEARPENSRALQNLAEAYLEAGQRSRGLALYEDALQQGLREPVQPAGHYNLGNHYFDAGNVERAFHHFTRAIELKPDYGKAWANRAVLLLQGRRFEAAAEDFRQATEWLPGDPIIRVQLAICLEQIGAYEEAWEALTEAQRLGHGVPESLAVRIQQGLSARQP